MSTKTTKPLWDGLPKEMVDWAKASEAVAKSRPNLYQFLTSDTYDFKGLTLIPSSRGGFLAIMKKFSGEDLDDILFANGETPLDALIRCEDALRKNVWRKERPFMREPVKPVT